jgi:hypothetical protein
MKKNVYLLVFSFLAFVPLYAQVAKQVAAEEQLWLGYFNQTRLSNKWGLWTDVHFRSTDDFVGAPSKFLFRAGLMYYLTDDFKFTNGYNFINHFPEEGHANVSMPEHRAWHQLQLHTKYGKVRTMQWLRLEERWRRNIKNDNELADGYRFDTRLRFNYLANFPLSKKGIVPKTLAFTLSNEIFINLGRKVLYNTFDQNRFFAGLSYQTSAHSNLQFGYMNVYQQLRAGNSYRNISSIRVFYFQNLDVRKNKKQH